MEHNSFSENINNKKDGFGEIRLLRVKTWTSALLQKLSESHGIVSFLFQVILEIQDGHLLSLAGYASLEHTGKSDPQTLKLGI